MSSLLAKSPPPASPETLYQTAQQEVARIVAAVSTGKPCDLDSLKHVIADLITSLACEDKLVVLALKEGETHLDLPRHLVNVAIFAIKIGQAVSYGEEDLQRLALAACLHDVGMTSVPRSILEKPGVLAPEELALIRQHPEQGFRLLQLLGPQLEWIALVALHEQEREDGSGYPQGLKGEQIHEYAKIVGLADVYESLTHARSFRRKRVVYDAPEIARQSARIFPERILQAMVSALSISPASSVSHQAASPEPTQEGRQEAAVTTDKPPKVLYQTARQEVAQVLAAVSAGKSCELIPLQTALRDFIVSLANGDELLALVLERGETQLNLPSHMVNVTVLAIKIGQGIGLGQEDLQRLALAASLHDIGMMSVPRRIQEKPEPLAPEDLALIRQHPEQGFRMLRELGLEDEHVAIVALQEQEREDGSGYPRGLKGDQIHEYAKIVGLADVYESLTHPRPDQKVRVPFDAVKEIVTANRRMFPTRILKGIIQGLSTFPVGSLVRLNSKEIVRVVSTNPAFPMRPVVEIIAGPKGEQLPSPRRVDLAQNSLFYITDLAPRYPIDHSKK